MANTPERGLVWRAASLVAVAIVILLWRGCLGGPRYVIQIRFDLDPQFLFGAEVVIDGEVAGTLQRAGGRTITGFRVEEGDHTVELRLDGCNSEPARITSGFGGATVMLMAVPDSELRGVESVCVVRLEH